MREEGHHICSILKHEVKDWGRGYQNTDAAYLEILGNALGYGGLA